MALLVVRVIAIRHVVGIGMPFLARIRQQQVLLIDEEDCELVTRGGFELTTEVACIAAFGELAGLAAMVEIEVGSKATDLGRAVILGERTRRCIERTGTKKKASHERGGDLTVAVQCVVI